MSNSNQGNYTLKEWLSRHNINKDHDIADFKNLFNRMDLSMKRLHQSGKYITSFHVDDIFIFDQGIYYAKTSKLYLDDRDYMIHRNIIYLSCLAVGVYGDCLGYIHPDYMSNIRANFSSFSMFIPEDVVPYYKGIIERDSNVYLSDYIKARVERDIDRDRNLLGQGETASNHKGISTYSKSTFAGRMLTDDSNKAAFIQLILFPVIIFLMAILIPIMIILGM